jgi:pectinesterase inhibitor-like protein
MSSNIYSLLSVLLIFQFIYPTLGGPRTQGLIDKICRQVEDYGYCNTVYNQNIKTPETDIFGLAQITLEQGTNNATNTYLFARRLLGNTTDPALKGYLSGA